MFTDCRTVTGKLAVQADVCVIGTGAAGLTLARSFLDTGHHVTFLESGYTTGVSTTDAVYELESTRTLVSSTSRARGFGGTTNVWAGRWKRHDGIDFEMRPWIPHSGWPITLEALKPYYERMESFLEIQGAATEDSLLPDPFEPTPFVFLPKSKRKLGVSLSSRIARHKTLQVFEGAHTVSLEKQGTKVIRAHVRLPNGTEGTIAATYFVVAAGGIENARLLLTSDIGNEYDQVGRYYMDHPKCNVGVLETYELLSFPRVVDGAYQGFKFTDATQKSEETLNSYIMLQPLEDRSPFGRIKAKLGDTRSPVIVLRNFMEQVPDPENRITLSSKLDMFGIPLPKITWGVGPLDQKTIRVMHQRFADVCRTNGLGVFESTLLDNHSLFPEVKDASHHMGATRMGADAHTSVVDRDCRVHSMDNLFVAGPSVFPTGGYANPVATISALALRLADHVRGKLEREKAI